MPVTQVGSNPVAIVNAGDPPGVIYNRSTTVQALWGTSASTANRQDASILDPNATLAVDGSSDIWMVSGTGAVISIDYMPTGAAFFRALTSGFGQLVIPAILSPNFIHNVSGWSINKDGSAEFNNLTIRGTFFGSSFILNASGLFMYTGTPALGNLWLSAASAAGTDQFGNGYGAGLGVTNGTLSVVLALAGELDIFNILNKILVINGSQGILIGQGGANNPQIQLNASGASSLLQFLTNVSGVAAAVLQASSAGAPELQILGPQKTAAGINDLAGILIDSNNSPLSARMLLGYQPAGLTLAGVAFLDDAGLSVNVGYINGRDATTTPAPTANPVAESWHAISLAAGLTGTARVRRAGEQHGIWFDFRVTWTTTAATTFTIGSLPNASYYPTADKRIPMGWNGTPTVASSAPRVFIPTSGTLQVIVPASSAGGTGDISCMIADN